LALKQGTCIRRIRSKEPSPTANRPVKGGQRAGDTGNSMGGPRPVKVLQGGEGYFPPHIEENSWFGGGVPFSLKGGETALYLKNQPAAGFPGGLGEK